MRPTSSSRPSVWSSNKRFRAPDPPIEEIRSHPPLPDFSKFKLSKSTDNLKTPAAKDLKFVQKKPTPPSTKVSPLPDFSKLSISKSIDNLTTPAAKNHTIAQKKPNTEPIKGIPPPPPLPDLSKLSLSMSTNKFTTPVAKNRTPVQKKPEPDSMKSSWGDIMQEIRDRAARMQNKQKVKEVNANDST